MRRPTGDQEVAGSTPAEVGNIHSWRLIMKHFLRHSLPLIQEGQLSVSSERMCTTLVNRLEVGKGRGECFYFFGFFTFIPVPPSSLSLSFISSTISSISFLSFSGR